MTILYIYTFVSLKCTTSYFNFNFDKLTKENLSPSCPVQCYLSPMFIWFHYSVTFLTQTSHLNLGFRLLKDLYPIWLSLITRFINEFSLLQSRPIQHKLFFHNWFYYIRSFEPCSSANHCDVFFIFQKLAIRDMYLNFWSFKIII